MKKLFIILALLIASANLNLNAQSFDEEEVIITPDTLHLYFHGCSPHGERILITNHTTEGLVINRCYSENFRIECLYEGSDIAETGFFIPVWDSIEILVFATPEGKAEQDYFGKLYIDTDMGLYSIVLYYEAMYATDEASTESSLYPNPAQDQATLKGQQLGILGVYNALGQKVAEIEAKGNETNIPTAQYPNGTYFVRTSHGSTLRLMIAH